MIIPDINILIYAVNKTSRFHLKAKKWLENVLSGNESVGFAWIVLLGFIRITTSAKVMPRPIQPEQAVRIIDGWLAVPIARVINPADQHWKIFKEILEPLGTAGNLTSDAHLATLSIEHRGCLYSSDNDFGRFKNLRWKNPLI